MRLDVFVIEIAFSPCDQTAMSWQIAVSMEREEAGFRLEGCKNFLRCLAGYLYKSCLILVRRL